MRTPEEQRNLDELERDIHEEHMRALQAEMEALAEQQRLIELEAAKAEGATESALGTPIDELIDDLLNK